MTDVYISPSVQHFNIGVGGYGSEESRMNLVADILEYELNRHGLTTARNNPAMTLTEVVADSNSKNPTVHVALHSNALDGTARGAEVYAHRFGTNSEILATDVYEEIEKIAPTPGLGVKEGYIQFNGQGMFELKNTISPAILIEYAFHDNPEDATFIIDNIYELGVATAKGVLEYFGIPYNEDSEENITFLKNKYNSKYFT